MTLMYQWGPLSDAVPLCPASACIDDPTQSWVFWLCVLFGFGFFVLLVVVVFLLSAVTCSCVRDNTQITSTLGLGGGGRLVEGYSSASNADVIK